MENDIWIWALVAAILLQPIFFTMGWIAARVDMKAVLKQAKSVPDSFYRSLNALVDRNSAQAAQHLEEAAGGHPDAYRLNLTLGKLYRQRGEKDKAISMHKSLLDSPDVDADQRSRVLYELALDFQNAGLVDRAEETVLPLQNTRMAKEAREVLLNIYQQDRDWEKAAETALLLSHDEQTYRFEIAQFHCETAQAALFASDADTARRHVATALEYNAKCTRANMILGDIEYKAGNFQAAADAYRAIEKQNYAYLSMVGERLYDAFDAQGKAAEGLDILIGYMKTFPQLDLTQLIYEKSLLLYGEERANQTVLELVRARPDLNGVYRLLSMSLSSLHPSWKADAEMIRNVIDRQIQKSLMYRCRNCNFKSQVFFWHCPACNKWETFTPNKTEV